METNRIKLDKCEVQGKTAFVFELIFPIDCRTHSVCLPARVTDQNRTSVEFPVCESISLVEVQMTSEMEQTRPAEEPTPPLADGLLTTIMSPGVDRMIAIIAIVPFIYTTYVRFQQGVLNIPRGSAIIMSLMLIGTMVVRRAPKRVTPNPLFWILAFVATYGTLGPTLFSERGIELVPSIVSNLVAVLAMAIVIFARVSLGRNIGFVPAQRQLVTTGAYGLVRHPIYTGIFVAYAGLILRAYSPLNLAMVLVISALFLIKSIIEENFLKSDPEYAEYMNRVRYRWFPGIA